VCLPFNRGCYVWLPGGRAAGRSSEVVCEDTKYHALSVVAQSVGSYFMILTPLTEGCIDSICNGIVSEEEESYSSHTAY
jgi:hypothetical protein